jgi:hypothetical protein
MGDHVVGDDEVGASSLSGQAAASALTEEVVDRVDPQRNGACRFRGRIDAEDGNPASGNSEHVAVVRGDLDHQTVGPRPSASISASDA